LLKNTAGAHLTEKVHNNVLHTVCVPFLVFFFFFIRIKSLFCFDLEGISTSKIISSKMCICRGKKKRY